MNNPLYQQDASRKFYEDRYKKGYMDEWPAEKKQRVFEIIRQLDIPETGTALDFGCGQGVFTDVLRQALPAWKIYGCDISEHAIDCAITRFPECSFFLSDNRKKQELQFDFLFSHHVLEHVFDIQKTVAELNAYLKPNSFAFHIFPCGNEGSLEYKVCNMVKGGINPEMENRFFYEDEGHLRRLTTEQTNQLMEVHGFALQQEFYSNHQRGAIKWFSQSSPAIILKFANPAKSVNSEAFLFLMALRIKLLSLFLLQLPVLINEKMDRMKLNKLLYYAIKLLNAIPFLVSYPIYRMINYRASTEWNLGRNAKHGSEMYLLYKRK